VGLIPLKGEKLGPLYILFYTGFEVRRGKLKPFGSSRVKQFLKLYFDALRKKY
jgi:hypothetical protein